MARPIVVSIGASAAAVATAVCASQAPPAASLSGGVLNLNGATVVNGVAVLDVARQIVFASTGNNSNTTFTIFGSDANGVPISESLVGANAGSVISKLSYKTVSFIGSYTPSGATPAGLTVGTTAPATSSQWVRFDSWNCAAVAIQVNVTGTVNATVQQTLDDPNSPTDPVAVANMTWLNHPDPALNGLTANVQGNYAYTPVFARVVLNSGSGSVKATFLQPDSGNY
jgi:hypothetical protein